MSDDYPNDAPPMEVSSSPVAEQIWSGVRQVAIAGGAYAAGLGVVEQDTLALLGVVGVVVWGVIASQIKTLERSRKLATLAKAAPDSIAVLK